MPPGRTRPGGGDHGVRATTPADRTALSCEPERHRVRAKRRASRPEQYPGRLRDAVARQRGESREAHHDVEGTVYRRHHGRDVALRRQTRRVEHVGPSLLEGLEPADRIAQVRSTVQEILGPRGQGEGNVQLPRRFCRGPDPFYGEPEFVDRFPCFARCILDGHAHQPRLGGAMNHAGQIAGLGAPAVLEVGAHRQVGGIRDVAGVREDLLG